MCENECGVQVCASVAVQVCGGAEMKVCGCAGLQVYLYELKDSSY